MKCLTCNSKKEDDVHKAVTIKGRNENGVEVKETYLLHGTVPIITEIILKG